LLERYRPRCVFCGEVENVTEYREKYICKDCLGELAQYRV